jgi:hypothetical protein
VDGVGPDVELVSEPRRPVSGRVSAARGPVTAVAGVGASQGTGCRDWRWPVVGTGVGTRVGASGRCREG